MKSFALSEWMLSHRKIAVSFLVLAFLLLIMVRYGLFPSRTATDEIDWRTQWTGILDGLISTIVVSFVVASTLWWTKPPLERIPPGFEILPGSISNILEKSARESTEWEYVGHTARYVRNRIIPILLEQSSRNNRNVRVRMLVIDPSDNQLCQKYADYRNRSRSGHLFQNKWTKEDVQAQILVTLAKLVNLHHDSNFFSCEIRLRRFLSQFRVDASYDQLTVTQEDPQEPAYQYPRGSRFYNYYKRENFLIWDQSKVIEINECSGNAAKSIPQQIENIAALLGIVLEGTDIKEKASDYSINDRSPYA